MLMIWYILVSPLWPQSTNTSIWTWSLEVEMVYHVDVTPRTQVHDRSFPNHPKPYKTTLHSTKSLWKAWNDIVDPCKSIDTRMEIQVDRSTSRLPLSDRIRSTLAHGYKSQLLHLHRGRREFPKLHSILTWPSKVLSRENPLLTSICLHEPDNDEVNHSLIRRTTFDSR